MTNSDTTPSPETADQPHIGHWIVTKRGPLANALLAAAVAFAVFPFTVSAVLGVQEGASLFRVWAVICAVLAAAGVIYLRFRIGRAETVPEGEPVLVAFTIVGLAGLATLLVLGLGLPFGPWSESFVPAAPTPEQQGPTQPLAAPGERVPILKVWRDNAGRLAFVAAAFIAGLVLMFLSVLPLRRLERRNAQLRRILYGYNTFLNALLLLIIFGLVNVLSYVHLWPFSAFARDIDWTKSGLYTLNHGSVKILTKELKGDVRLVALLRPTHPVIAELNRLERSCQQYTDRIKLDIIAKGTPEFQEALLTYAKYIKQEARHAQFFEAGLVGIVVLYRVNGQEYGDFIPFIDLFTHSQTAAQDVRFNGENELMRALRKLTQREPTRVVFTTGHGEISFDDPPPNPMRRRLPPNAATLKKAIGDRGPYEFRTVTLGPTGGPDLREADIVVVARPTQEFEEKAVEALRQYMNPPAGGKKGKLVVLFDVVEQNGKMASSGLEALLAEFNIRVGTQRLLSFDRRLYPGVCVAQVSPDGDSGLAAALSATRRTLPLTQPREVRPIGQPRRADRVETLLETVSPAWAESDLTAHPVELQRTYFSPAFPPDRRPKLSTALPVAVTVAEVAPDGQTGGPTEVPRLIVFGSASWLTLEGFGRTFTEQEALQMRDNFSDFLDNCFSWLRGRESLGENIAPPRVTGRFSLSKQEDLRTDAQQMRLAWLPLLYVVLGLAALGGGVWLARRR